MPITLPFRPRRESYPPDMWTQCPGCSRDALQQAPRQGPARLHLVRPPLPRLGTGPPRPAAGPRLVPRARRRARLPRPPGLRRQQAVPGPDRGGPDGDRATRRGHLGLRDARRAADRHLRPRLRLHGRLHGLGGRREGDPGRRGSACRGDPARRRQRLGRGADAGGHAGPHAAGQDDRLARGPPGGRPPLHLGPGRSHDGGRLRLLRGAGRRQRGRAECPHRVRRRARLGRDDRRGAAARLPAGRVPLRPRLRGPDRDPRGSPGRAGRDPRRARAAGSRGRCIQGACVVVDRLRGRTKGRDDDAAGDDRARRGGRRARATRSGPASSWPATPAGPTPWSSSPGSPTVSRSFTATASSATTGRSWAASAGSTAGAS